MPGVASQSCDRPLRVHWLWASVAICLLAWSAIVPAQDDENDSLGGKPRRSRESLVNPEALDEVQADPELDEELSADDFLNEEVVAVVIEGHVTIAEHAIQRSLKVKPGRVVTPREVQEDVVTLRRTQWFSSVRPLYRRTAEGLVLVYEVRERPIIRTVRFIGNKNIKTGQLEAETGLRPNQPFDVALNREAVARIKSMYLEKGYRHAQVEMTQGNDPSDREVVISISEGPKTQVRWIRFEGNTFTRDTMDTVLKTKLASKMAILGVFGGTYAPELVENDVITITQYYNKLGFFDAHVSQRVDESADHKSATVVFTVEEGQRFRVRNVELVGYEALGREQLNRNHKLKAGDYFNYLHMQHDVVKMKDQYDTLGRLFAQVVPTPIFLDEPGVIDLEYQINEDKPYLVGDIHVRFRDESSHTREDVILNSVTRMAKPGQLADGRKIDLARRRVLSSQLWDQADPPTFEIIPVEGLDYRLASDDPLSEIARGQDQEESFFAKTQENRQALPAAGYGHGVSSRRRSTDRIRPAVNLTPVSRNRVVPALQQRVSKPLPAARPVPGEVSTPSAPLGRGVSSTRAKARAKAAQAHPALYNIDPAALFGEDSDPDLVIRGQSDVVPRGQSIDRNGVPVPQDFGAGTSNSGNPYGGTTFGRAPTQPPGFVDLDIDVTEGRTGRLMFGAGVNSNNGLVGSAVLQEDNFDITRPPRSWADISNGYAWRGAGQSFRLEAQPGNQVSRYVVSWNDPFFMRTDYNLGVSGFYFNRFYNEWTEDRLGGRISVGKAINEYWSGSLALRLEDVKIRSIQAGSPTDLTSVAGDNFLSTVSATLANDTRDNAFIPSQGHMLEGTFEQAFGDFNYPRVELTGSQYFTVRERADGLGKHIVQLYGQLAWSGDNTPIFERYYAGGYSSFRGFAFRGMSPIKSGVRVGGNFMALGTAEYMLPLTANDQIRAVAFTDFGTVEQDIGFDDFRVSAGVGLRLVIPAMGPAPIAFDFAWPIVDQKTDNRRMFSFYVGFTR